MTTNGIHYTSDEDSSSGFGCYEDTARSVEIVREENKDGQLGSFGFTIFQERPPRIGTVIPGGPADKARLKKGDMVLAVNGQDITTISHKEVTNIIKSCKTQNVWLSVCEGDGTTMNSSLGSSPQKSFFQSTPAILSESGSPTSSLRRIHQIPTSMGGAYNGSGDIALTHYKNRGNGAEMIRRNSPTNRRQLPPTESNYVTLMPPQSYTVTRISTLVMYCGPVKIPGSWSSRGVSSLCIQECARQLLSKRKVDDFLKVQLEVSQSSFRISSIGGGNVLVKHRRKELYYCGSCTSDEQYFAVVSKLENDGPSTSSPIADLCHIFKLLPDTKLSTYVIDRSKSSREVRSGSPSLVKSCTEITDTIQSIFQSESSSKDQRLEKTSSMDNLEYGIVRGISTLQLAGSVPNGSPEQSSPMLKRKKSNVIDLRAKSGSPTGNGSGNGKGHRRNRSISNPTDPSMLFSQRTLHASNSAGYIPTNGGEATHIRMNSDGLVTSIGSNSSVRARSNLLHSSLPREDAKRISDCSFSSMSSDHSGHESSTGSPMSTPSKSQSPTPVPPHIPHNYSPQRPLQTPARKLSSMSRGGAISPSDNNALYGSKVQLRRQGSEGSIVDLTATLQMSPYHHLGLPSKNSGLSSSVDSIVTITTLAEDDIDLVVGRVAGWCGSFDKLLTDPLGLQYFLQFLETEHSEENLLFWKDVEEYKKMPLTSLSSASKKIYDEYLSNSAPHLINIDDIVKKNVEAKMDRPTATLFDEVQKEIYHLMRMDCYPRFQKSPIIKESLLAEMEGRPLPIETTQPSKPAKQANRQSWEKKKFSLLDRLKGVSTKDTRMAPLINPPVIAASQDPPTGTTSSTSFNSLSSLTHSLVSSGERRRSKKEKKAELKRSKSGAPEAPSYHPEDNLKHLQAHKGNLFEINLPNRISKIIEAPPSATVREALTNVLKKYNYSLDVMEVRLTSTLQTISVDSPASVLIGKHVSIMKSKHTVTATFPDLKEVILPADGSKTVRDLMDHALLEKGKAQPYSIYVDGARAPLELDMSSSVLDGHTVTVKYLPASTSSSVTTSVPGNGGLSEGYGGLEDLISEIARLSADTLSDQRTVQDESKTTKWSPKVFKKPKKGSHLSPKESTPKFTRTKSGATVSNTNPIIVPHARSLSPPPSLTGSAPQRLHYPPPPASDPPNLSHSTLNKPFNGQWEYNHPSYHQHQRSGDAMSGVSLGSESSVDSITHELATDRKAANRMLLNQWVMQSQTSMASTSYGGPNFFPTALGSMDTIERNQAMSRQQMMMNMKRGDQLDTGDIYNGRQPLQQQNMGVVNNHPPSSPSTNYPWKSAQQNKFPRPRRLSSDHGSVVSNDSQHFSDSGSMVSNSSSSRGVPPTQRRPPPSPTTHVLVIDESTQSSETYV